MNFLFPPRPRGSVPWTDLKRLEATGEWVAQPKYQGARVVVQVEGRGVSFLSRQGRPFRSWSPPASLVRDVLALPGLGRRAEWRLDGELLIKTTAPDTKGKLVLFDVLHAGKYLFGRGQMERLALLSEVCGGPTALDPWRGMGLIASGSVLMAPTFESGFEERFHSMACDEVEGLVLRRRSSVLDNFGSKEYEVDWLVRCRRPDKLRDF